MAYNEHLEKIFDHVNNVNDSIQETLMPYISGERDAEDKDITDELAEQFEEWEINSNKLLESTAYLLSVNEENKKDDDEENE